MGSLFQELKRRKVLRVAAVYAVVAWLIVQVVDVVLPTFNVPQWVNQTVIVLLLLGLPVVIILAWAFDFDAQGIHKTEQANTDELVSLRKRDYFSAALVIVLVAVITWQQLGTPEIVIEDPMASKIGLVNSIAVLPLDNLMNDPSRNYFADGMTEAITAELAKIRALRVISRTSVMQYRDTLKTMPQIAEELGVDALVEGSVQVDGDTVRVTVQLIHGPSDTHLWSEIYTNTYESILVLQSDVALAITDEINAEITGEERQRITASHIVDPEAYDAFLLGQYFLEQQNQQGFLNAIEQFRMATQIDTEFAEAWAELGNADIFLRGWGLATPVDVIPEAREALLKAIELDDSMAEAHANLAQIAMSYDYEWEQAESRYRRALELGPNSVDALNEYVWYLVIVGRTEEAAGYAATALDLDSVDRFNVRNAIVAFSDSQPDRVVARLHTILAEDPGYIPAIDSLWYTYSGHGRLEELVDISERWVEVAGRDVISLTRLGQAYYWIGQVEEAGEVLEEILDNDITGTGNHANLGMLYVALGELDLAFEQFEKAYTEKEWFLMWMRTIPFRTWQINQANFQRFREDERYWELMERINFPPFPPGHPGYEEEQTRLSSR